jgi:hypothetical protein
MLAYREYKVLNPRGGAFEGREVLDCELFYSGALVRAFWRNASLKKGMADPFKTFVTMFRDKRL